MPPPPGERYTNSMSEKDEWMELQANFDTEISNLSNDEVSIETKYPNKFAKFYYNHILVDKSTLNVSTKQAFLYNHDLRPVEEKRRSFQVAATGLQLGLNWWQCWLTVWVGYFLAGVLVTVVSRMGSSYHISFPVSTRASFGVFFSTWPILNRVVMAIVWYAAQSFVAVGPVSIMLRSVFGKDLDSRQSHYISYPNLTQHQFLCFILFWLFSFPFLFIAPQNLRFLFTIKACMVPFAAFGMLAWVLHTSHGKIELNSLNHDAAQGSLSWAFIRTMMGCLANFSTLIINVPDFSRFAKTTNSAKWVQLFSIPFLFSIMSLIGILTNAAGYKIFQVNYWSPVEVLAKMLETNYTGANRFGAFVISFIFMVAQLGTNISANSLSAGADMTALLPKYINIKRGSVLCALLALCICPWNFMASSSKFTDALSAYAIFLSSIAGIIVADYYVVRRGCLELLHLYSVHENSYYMYGNKYGMNFRAVIAYLCGIAPNMPGFIATVGNGVHVSSGALKIYYLNYLVGFTTAFIVYLFLCYFFPPRGSPVLNLFAEKGWHEEWAYVEDFDALWIKSLDNPGILQETKY